jgi:hypothetical protein
MFGLVGFWRTFVASNHLNSGMAKRAGVRSPDGAKRIRVASVISCALSLSSEPLRASRWLDPSDEAPPQWAATDVRIVVGIECCSQRKADIR